MEKVRLIESPPCPHQWGHFQELCGGSGGTSGPSLFFPEPVGWGASPAICPEKECDREESHKVLALNTSEFEAWLVL